LVAADVKTKGRAIAPINTLPLESERVTAHSNANSDSWLSDLSENTGAMPAAPSFLNARLDDVADSTQISTPAKLPAGAAPNTVALSPFSDVVSSTAAAHAPTSPQPNQPQPSATAPANTNSNSHSFSSSSSSLHQNPGPTRPSAVLNKREETISIVVNKKSIAFGSVALGVLLAIAGFLYFRPTGSATAPTYTPHPSATIRPDSQNASFTTVSHPTFTGSIPLDKPVTNVARVVKKPAQPKKKAPKRKPNAYQNYGNYSSTTTYRNQSPNVGAPARSYDYQPPPTPVRQPDPVVVAPQPVHVPDQQPVRAYNRYASRYVNRHADQGLDKATNSKPGRAIKRLLNKGFGLLDKITD